MSDKELKPHGVPQPKGTAWLKEVQVDAARAAVEHVRKQIERKDFEVAKANGITAEDITANGKRFLESGEAFSFSPEPVEPEDEEVTQKPLSKMNKAELLAIVDEEEVDVEDSATNAQLVAAIEASREGDHE